MPLSLKGLSSELLLSVMLSRKSIISRLLSSARALLRLLRARWMAIVKITLKVRRLIRIRATVRDMKVILPRITNPTHAAPHTTHATRKSSVILA